MSHVPALVMLLGSIFAAVLLRCLHVVVAISSVIRQSPRIYTQWGAIKFAYVPALANNVSGKDNYIHHIMTSVIPTIALLMKSP